MKEEETKMTRVLLVCGSGASSGFMASNIRKAAKSKHVDISVIARSEKNMEEYLPELDVLLIGPHYKQILDDTKKLAETYNVKVEVIDAKAYGALDGNAVLNHILEIIGGENNG